VTGDVIAGHPVDIGQATEVVARLLVGSSAPIGPGQPV